MSILLSPKKIGNIEIKNRIVMPPMCMYSADEKGLVDDFHIVHYGARAIGGTGLIIVEATAVEARGRISENDLGLFSDTQIDGHRRLNETCHKYGSKTAVQLAHAGRKSFCKTTTPIAPSAIRFSDDKEYQTPIEMSLEDIEKLKKDFTDAANRAKSAGYDIVEIHAAHGYLLNEFLSLLSNKREDSYGGNIENRCRLILEISSDIIKKVKIPLMVRISADEWCDGGWNLDDSVYLATELRKIGVDAIHVSAGGNQPSPKNAPKLTPLYQVDYAKTIKENVGIPTIAVGIIRTPGEGEALLHGGVCDFVAYGRELLRNPNLALYAAKELDKQDAIFNSYIRAFK